MEILHERDVIRSARDRWLEQYKRDADSEVFPHGRTRGQVREALAALDLETCARADVDAAIGVTGWAGLRCDECGETPSMVIRFGEEPDWEARWQELCADCLGKGLSLLRETRPKP